MPVKTSGSAGPERRQMELGLDRSSIMLSYPVPSEVVKKIWNTRQENVHGKERKAGGGGTHKLWPGSVYWEGITVCVCVWRVPAFILTLRISHITRHPVYHHAFLPGPSSPSYWVFSPASMVPKQHCKKVWWAMGEGGESESNRTTALGEYS